MILVDSSVLIDFLKGKENISSQKLKEVIVNEIPFAITPLILQEILQGSRDKKEFDVLNEYLTSQRFLHPQHPIQTYVNSAEIYFKARKKGITIRSTLDCLIAQIAIENDAFLLHNDTDFEQIAKFCPLKFY